MYTHTELYIHPHLHVSTDSSVGCPYRQPALVTGMIDIHSFMRLFYAIPVPSGGHWYGQPTRKGLHEHAYIYLHITGARHAH